MGKLEKLLEIVTKQEDYYYELAHKELRRNNLVANQIMVACASAYQRIRYTVEDMLREEQEADNERT